MRTVDTTLHHTETLCVRHTLSLAGKNFLPKETRHDLCPVGLNWQCLKYVSVALGGTWAAWWHTRRNQISSFGETESPFKSVGASVRSTTGSRGVRISGSNAGYTMFRGSVKGTGYPLHSPVSPSSPLPCVTVCHHISAGVYYPPSHSCWSHVPFYITVAAGT